MGEERPNSEIKERDEQSDFDNKPIVQEGVDGLAARTNQVKDDFAYQKRTDRPPGRITNEFGKLEFVDSALRPESRSRAREVWFGRSAPLPDRDNLSQWQHSQIRLQVVGFARQIETLDKDIEILAEDKRSFEEILQDPESLQRSTGSRDIPRSKEELLAAMQRHRERQWAEFERRYLSQPHEREAWTVTRMLREMAGEQ